MIDPSRYGPWAVIAGGSEGVGASFAHQLADAGLNLVLLARKPGPLEETAEAVRAKGVEVRTLAVDLIDPDSVKRIQEATSDLEVGLLVYNAGANSYGHEFVTGDLDRFQNVIDLNITAQMALVQLFGAPMKERRRGGLLLVGSLAGFMGSAQISVYSAVKAFCRVFAEGLWLEMADYDVDVLEFVLGVTRTPAMERAGLNFDVPGMHVSEPDDVARQALSQLTDGPVQIAAGNERLVEVRSGHDRSALLRAAREKSRKLLPPSSE
ncbi:SDR family NAD(P)-dependent oxidoreductase [Nocardioides sp. dk4132]|uniref:SDR family NAD(P)-dependent oxidoreductase n=1 Tax=unclassified Nocardioides TaxID=2615069 RepID=UPI0012956A23|nr:MULTISPECIES: SDR family NAD(P)-dependent oxidoreductase [unclassified Nocardioides]MQW74351.1 SDR family NAD(P)-dependent oxidoreductase [Nocardioides sp. dk4132]QGA06297.1 SDR family NAD(P)-dependent oxidoreductase [Nocardioides sp. dk884]